MLTVRRTIQVASQDICKWLCLVSSGGLRESAFAYAFVALIHELDLFAFKSQHVGLETYIPASVVFCPYQR
jgi:hypothetical protein